MDKRTWEITWTGKDKKINIVQRRWNFLELPLLSFISSRKWTWPLLRGNTTRVCEKVESVSLLKLSNGYKFFFFVLNNGYNLWIPTHHFDTQFFQTLSLSLSLSLPIQLCQSPRIFCPGSICRSTKLIQVSFKEFWVRQENFSI